MGPGGIKQNKKQLNFSQGYHESVDMSPLPTWEHFLLHKEGCTFFIVTSVFFAVDIWDAVNWRKVFFALLILYWELGLVPGVILNDASPAFCFKKLLEADALLA